MYKSKDGILINADVNGSYNILRKCNPEMLWQDEIKGVSLHPVRVNI
jgi:putative transposase